eukprot:15469167-Alexandrium_andersonii.AAC.1
MRSPPGCPWSWLPRGGGLSPGARAGVQATFSWQPWPWAVWRDGLDRAASLAATGAAIPGAPNKPYAL